MRAISKVEEWSCKPSVDLSRNSYNPRSFPANLQLGQESHLSRLTAVYHVTNGRSLVIDNLRPQTNIRNANKVGVIQFYFDDHDPNDQTVDDVFRSFVKQIIYQMSDKGIPESLSQMYESV